MQESTFDELLKEWFTALASGSPVPPSIGDLRERAKPWWKKSPDLFGGLFGQVSAPVRYGKEAGPSRSAPRGVSGIPVLLLDEDTKVQTKTTARVVMSELVGSRLELRLSLDQPLLGAKSAQVTICDGAGSVKLDVYAEMAVGTELVVDQFVSDEEAAFALQFGSPSTAEPLYALIKADQFDAGWSIGEGKELGVWFERLSRLFDVGNGKQSRFGQILGAMVSISPLHRHYTRKVAVRLS